MDQAVLPQASLRFLHHRQRHLLARVHQAANPAQREPNVSRLGQGAVEQAEGEVGSPGPGRARGLHPAQPRQRLRQNLSRRHLNLITPQHHVAQMAQQRDHVVKRYPVQRSILWTVRGELRFSRDVCQNARMRKSQALGSVGAAR